MRILFLHSNIPNYVADGLFHGLRTLPDIEVVDMPRHDVMYKDATPEMLFKTGSRGRTLYALLPKESDAIRSARVFWQRELDSYDFVIFTDIAQMPGLFMQVWNSLGSKKAMHKIVIVDGYDQVARYPFFNTKETLLHHPWVYALPLHKVRYFKREFEDAAGLYGHLHLMQRLRKTIRHYPISMSIPAEAITRVGQEQKHALFVRYNADPEIKDLFEQEQFAPVGTSAFRFGSNEAYDDELVAAKFGITVKRAGWDCLRHYEYAAKGVILCFKNLEQKPKPCAPFDLDKRNCIIYKDKEDLLAQLNALNQTDYNQLQENSYSWIMNYTCKEVAARFLERLISFKD
jgi:hypothetical protein